jgi:hypothetical protein
MSDNFPFWRILILMVFFFCGVESLLKTYLRQEADKAFKEMVIKIILEE